jgi:DNA-directed RNA polymerase sigma subunit (sigma70/sigma32)
MSIIRKNLLLLTPKEEKIIRLRFGIEEDINDVENFPVTEEMKRYLEK